MASADDSLHGEVLKLVEFVHGLENYTSALSSTNRDAEIARKFQDSSKIVLRINSAGVFSENETLDDVPTDSLVLMVMPALMWAILLQKRTDRTTRKNVVVEAKDYFGNYLRLAKLYAVEGSAKDINKPLSRQEKVKQFHDRKELEEYIASVIGQFFLFIPTYLPIYRPTKPQASSRNRSLPL